MIIPIEQLSADALQGLIEAFIARDGTDYGEVEYAFDDKVEQVKRQLFAGDIVVAFDYATESANLLTKQAYEQIS